MFYYSCVAAAVTNLVPVKMDPPFAYRFTTLMMWCLHDGSISDLRNSTAWTSRTYRVRSIFDTRKLSASLGWIMNVSSNSICALSANHCIAFSHESQIFSGSQWEKTDAIGLPFQEPKVRVALCQVLIKAESNTIFLCSHFALFQSL